MSPTAPASDDPTGEASPSPFADLERFVALPRLGALALSVDGTRLAVAVQTLDPQKKKWQSALWEVDPTGSRGARRLTRSAPGESSPVWAPDGSLLFTSARPDPDATEDGDPKPALWSLPAEGGEARLLLTRPAASPGSPSRRAPATWSSRRRRCPAGRTPRRTRNGGGSARTPG